MHVCRLVWQALPAGLGARSVQSHEPDRGHRPQDDHRLRTPDGQKYLTPACKPPVSTRTLPAPGITAAPTSTSPRGSSRLEWADRSSSRTRHIRRLGAHAMPYGRHEKIGELKVLIPRKPSGSSCGTTGSRKASPAAAGCQMPLCVRRVATSHGQQ